MKNILIIWEGLNSCSLLINCLTKSKNYSVDLIYTKASVPFKGVEKMFPSVNKLRLVNSLDEINKFKIIKDYDMVITTGWKSRNINKLLRLRKINNKQCINVFAIDNKIASDIFLNTEKRFNHTILRQFFGALYYRLILKRYIDFCFVPGNTSKNLMKLFGHESHKIFFGYYGAYEKIYQNNIEELPKENRFIFVGQLIKRKGILLLLDAFEKYINNGGSWDLVIIGGNYEIFKKMVLKTGINQKKIRYFPFMQPKYIAKEMIKSKAFILPSLQDNWGTVLCEAANAGCFLISSEQSGSTSDLIKNGINGFTFSSKMKNSNEILKLLMTKTETLSKNKSFRSRLRMSKNIASTYNSLSYKLAVEAMFIK